MPKLFQINADANWGSAGTITEQISNLVLENGWNSYVAYGRDINPSKAHLFRVGSKVDVYEHYVENIFFDNEGLASRNATKSLIVELQRIKPDIVHLHNIHDHWLNYRILFEYLNKTDIIIVWTFHDFWPITGHCHHFVYEDCDRFIKGCSNCPYTKGKIFPLLSQSKRNYNLKKSLFSANKYLTIVPVSEWVGDNIRKSFLKNKEICVINNGIDINIFKPTRFNELPNISEELEALQLRIAGKFVILAVSSQWKSGKKGLDDFISMGKLLKEDEIIVLVGVPDYISKKFPPNILGIRRTSNQIELAAIYSCSDVVCSFSSAETFGLTILEGYACGIPAVVYNNTAPPSLITNETGIVVDDKNFQQAYDAIQKLKLIGKFHYSETCIKMVHEHFNKDDCYLKYLYLYNRLLKKYKSQ